MEDAEEGYQEAEAALEIMEEAEAEEAELEEVEDLLEYYLQRATTTQSEAERLLAGSRDLEESIGVSLSARRFEVSQLLCLLCTKYAGVARHQGTLEPAAVHARLTDIILLCCTGVLRCGAISTCCRRAYTGAISSTVACTVPCQVYNRSDMVIAAG